MSSIRVDIVSDVVCPWCIVGLRQLEIAVQATGLDVDIHWHPFELNPQMPDGGQNLQEHMCEKYNTTVEQSNEARERLTAIGKEFDFPFNFGDQSRMVNTFKAHQLLHWAKLQGQEHELKLALFSAYFTEQLDINDLDVLLSIIDTIGLDKAEAQSVLETARHEADVRGDQKTWSSRGISSVPAMVFNNQYLVSGAQGVDNYTQILKKIDSDM